MDSEELKGIKRTLEIMSNDEFTEALFKVSYGLVEQFDKETCKES